jgi:hypothetical protein
MPKCDAYANLVMDLVVSTAFCMAIAVSNHIPTHRLIRRPHITAEYLNLGPFECLLKSVLQALLWEILTTKSLLS